MNLADILNDADLDFNDVKIIFKKISDKIDNKDYSKKLNVLFEFALQNDLSLFPKIKGIHSSSSPSETAFLYLKRWSNSYINSRNNLTINSSLKNYGEVDNALISRVAAINYVDKDTLEKYITGHFLFMSAENRNGTILEEYLAQVLEPYGWIWCAGSSYRAIDFCYLGKNPILLQVKNKYNTENSSSSAIRLGTTIQKWNRLKRPRAKEPNKTIPNWDVLQKIVKADTELASQLSEEAYLNYIFKNAAQDVLEL